MIALLASALLGLYVFAPYVLFHRLSSLFVPLKQFQRSKTEEIVSGIIVAGIPFVFTIVLFWFGWIGGCCVPLPLSDSQQRKVRDYQTVLTSLSSDRYFLDHRDETWDAAERVYKRQLDFISWNFAFVFVEALAFVLLVRYYWKLKSNKFYAWLASRVLLPAVSEWHVLLTDFNFPPRERRSVEVDALSKDNLLYRGSVVDHFLGVNGELSGLMLEDAERFQYQKLIDDRKADIIKDTEGYWKAIPGGGNFYLPGENIASLNIRYRLPDSEYQRVLEAAVGRLGLTGLSNLKVLAVPRKPVDSH